MDNENFKIRAYGLQELGIQYFPNSAPASASIQLKRWINLNKALLYEITEAGYHSGQRLLTPRQVQNHNSAFRASITGALFLSPHISQRFLIVEMLIY